jgi:hypothetical protein
VNINIVIARLCVEDLVPPAILQRVTDRAHFLDDVQRYVVMKDEDLFRATEACLRNLGRLDVEVEYDLGPDVRLRHVLVPELWERLRPGCRDALRQISTSLAEHNSDPARVSFWRRSALWSAEGESRLHTAAIRLREDIAGMAGVDIDVLAEQTRFAIAGSRVVETWAPDYPVYEPGFTFRLVPVVAWRVLRKEGREVR